MCNNPLYAYQMTMPVTSPFEIFRSPFGDHQLKKYYYGEYMPYFTKSQIKKKHAYLYCKTVEDWNLLKEREPDFNYTIHKCGQCIQCRLDYSLEWARRIVCEKETSFNSFFITLTYADQYLPIGKNGLPTCVLDHMSDFMKDLRRYCEYHYNHHGIRFYGAQEYGDESARPHAHLCIFNLPDELVKDFVQYKVSFNGDIYQNSPILSKIWGKGHVVIADLCYKSAAYVARYVTKKLKGIAKDTYEKLGIEPECARMSNRPGIGRAYFDLNKEDIYKYDEMYLPSIGAVSPSKYFDKLYKFEDPATMEILKGERAVNGNRATLNKMSRTDLEWDEYLKNCEAELKRKLDRLVRPDL